MSGGLLRIRFASDGDGTGELIASAESCGFCGTSRAYFSTEEIEKFAKSMADFSVAKEMHSIAGGYWKMDRSSELDQEHLRITVYPINSRGYFGVQVKMATKLDPGERPQSQQSATVELVTTSEPLARFSRALIGVLRGNAEEAVLASDQ